MVSRISIMLLMLEMLQRFSLLPGLYFPCVLPSPSLGCRNLWIEASVSFAMEVSTTGCEWAQGIANSSDCLWSLADVGE
ncbi:hypothetical protein Nepgr_004038 [Nepenthes gracilis]|uniref:Secreted protein n=1 Tax=Nepenthes gracilis TaxID=150966 RepID=A0AAD3S0R7_NEPGR|nr:hypothetical protein Nepgr_004038 [Nepenthes gracilis]